MIDSQTSGGWLAAIIASLFTGISVWYHLRKLKNVDVIDGGVSKSLDVVLKALRDEIARGHTERDELREQIALQAEEIASLKARLSKDECEFCGKSYRGQVND